MYIGITSKDPEERWKNGLGYDSQPFFNAIKKYGWNEFEHEIIAEHLTKNEACDMEKTLIKEFHTLLNENGYNASIGGLGSTTPKHPIYQFDLHGNLIKEYCGICDAAKENGILSSNIVNACSNKYKQCKGYVWQYVEDVPDLVKFKENFNSSNFDRYEPIYQFDINQNYVRSFKNASEAMQINSSWFSNSILDVCRGKYKHACGYIWRFQKDIPNIDDFKNEIIDFSSKPVKRKSVLQFDFNGNFIKEYPNTTIASEHMGCCPQMISFACCGKSLSAKGYLWRYKDDYHGEKISIDNPIRFERKGTIKLKNGEFEDNKENVPRYNHSRKAVLQFDLNGEFIQKFESVIVAAKNVKCSRSCIQAACSGRQKTCKGFKWRYERDVLEEQKSLK